MWYATGDCPLVATSFSSTCRPLLNRHIFSKLVLYSLCEGVLWIVFEWTGKQYAFSLSSS